MPEVSSLCNVMNAITIGYVLGLMTGTVLVSVIYLMIYLGDRISGILCRLLGVWWVLVSQPVFRIPGSRFSRIILLGNILSSFPIDDYVRNVTR